MMNNLYEKRNERKISVLYPSGSKSNILRKIDGVKIRSFTGVNKRRGIVIRERNGQIRSLLCSRCVEPWS
jgi:hypothetical protein